MTTATKSPRAVAPWRRTRRCPVCGGAGCLVTGDGKSPAAVVCANVPSDRAVGARGWLHILDTGGPMWPKWRETLRRLAG